MNVTTDSNQQLQIYESVATVLMFGGILDGTVMTVRDPRPGRPLFIPTPVPPNVEVPKDISCVKYRGIDTQKYVMYVIRDGQQNVWFAYEISTYFSMNDMLCEILRKYHKIANLMKGDSK
jgi:hypothetical protein